MTTALIDESLAAKSHTKPAFLRRVTIRNYKSIRFCDVELQPLTVLVGRNGAGKSNFLDALAFLRDTVTFGAAKAVKDRGGWAAVVSRMGDAKAIEIQIEVQFNGRASPLIEQCEFATYYFQVRGFRHNVVIGRESLILSNTTNERVSGFDLERNYDGNAAENVHVDTIQWKGQYNQLLNLKGGVLPISPQRPDICLVSILGFQPFLDLSESIQSMGFYNVNPDSIRIYQKPNLGILLEKNGQNVASVIQGLQATEPDTIDRVRDYLKLIVDDIERFDVVSYGEMETVRFRILSNTSDKPLDFDASSMSDGTLRVLAVLMAAFQVVDPQCSPSIVGIEEPETSLHPAAMRALVDALDEATQRTQVILTTHSADLLAGRDVLPGQILIVRNRNQQTYITPIDRASLEIIQEELYSLSDLQRMDKLDLDEINLKQQDILANFFPQGRL